VPAVQQVYDIGLIIPSNGVGAPHFTPNLPVLGSDFSASGIDGLLGRDVLRQCRMTYSGADNIVLLSF
jgi:hypothetical protein